MFKNYYYLIGVPQKATENDIKVAIENLEGKRSASLLYEIKMILLNRIFDCVEDTFVRKSASKFAISLT